MTITFKNAQSSFSNIDTMGVNDVVPAPFEFIRLNVQADWIDYNGHMNESMYLFVASLGFEGLVKYVGVTPEWTKKYGSYFTVENHNSYLLECSVGDELTVKTQLVDYDEKRIYVANMLYRGADLVFVSESISLYVNPISRKVEPAPNAMLQRLEKIASAHKDLSKDRLGRTIAIRK